ncbi:MAG: 16S rRNA (cytosine(1402)-N(4))-methyltransferase RsmH [Candidatus Cloacimonadota bacterium]|nr:16S rRNA (cytosine(1402)-N(4))-methyltransferase RsmH [Candidatus Cloacimonadota bacterium]
MTTYHTPVMVNECIEGLNLKENGIYVDATFGGGGHTEQILKHNNSVKVIGIDQDVDAINQSRRLQEKYNNRFVMIQDNFANLLNRISLEKIEHIDGILFDLGSSSFQFNEGSRGFSFQSEAKLDMRMNQDSELTAYDVINSLDLSRLAKIMREYGEEKKSYAIAKKIVKLRKINPIETTKELADIVSSIIHKKNVIKSQARVFQAFRIYVNDEIAVLEKALKDSVELLNPNGRIVVMSYHSLEDRTVKRFFIEEEKDCVCSPDLLICKCSKVSTLKIITKKPKSPTQDEIGNNPRARSAKLRIAERKEIL